MKRILKILTVPMLVLLTLKPVFAFDTPKIIIDYEELGVSAVIKEGITLVPLRSIFDALNATVHYDDITKTITGTQDDTIIMLTVGDHMASLNGKEIQLIVPAEIINGKTLVPLRFISESLKADVVWRDKTISINIPKKRIKVEDIPVKVAYPTYHVVRVIDGDTIVINYNGVEESVRLIGINTPEDMKLGSPHDAKKSQLVSEYTKSKLEGQEVGLELDVQERDQYGRLLGYVYLGDEMFNKTLLSEGLANIATIAPNKKHMDHFITLQTIAIENRRGLWVDDEYEFYENLTLKKEEKK